MKKSGMADLVAAATASSPSATANISAVRASFAVPVIKLILRAASPKRSFRGRAYGNRRKMIEWAYAPAYASVCDPSPVGTSLVTRIVTL